MPFCSLCTYENDQDIVVSLQPISLHAFKGQLGVEAIRMIMRRRGILFEDVLHSYENWQSKAINFLFQELPVLTLNGVQITQSLSIIQYAGRISQLIPKNLIDKAVGDTIMHILHGIISNCNSVWMASKEAKSCFSKGCWEIVKQRLLHLDEYLSKFKKNYVAGDTLSIADIYLCATLNEIISIFPEYKSFMSESLPCIQSVNKTSNNTYQVYESLSIELS